MIKELLESRKLINDNIEYKFSSNHKKIDFVADIGQLNQIIVNLFENAEGASIAFSKSPCIYTRISSIDDKVVIEVEDNGPGFAKNVLGHDPKPYFTTKENGTGLGLAIVQKIMQDHCGELEMYNSKKGGAVVRLIFNAEELKTKLK